MLSNNQYTFVNLHCISTESVTAPCLIRYLSVSEILTPWRPDPKCIKLSSCEPLRVSLIGE
jgi:hypothetical protein